MSENQERLGVEISRVRKHSLEICKPLKVEDYVVQPIVDVSPPKWHLAHTTWFFEQFILTPYLPSYTPYHPDYAYLFNSYYESLGERVDRFMRGNMTRPSTEEVMAYRAHVDRHLEELFKQEELPEKCLEIVELGLNHEQQHQELLMTDIKFILGHNPLFPAYNVSNIEKALSAGDKGHLNIKASVYEVGYKGSHFHFDNEVGRHKVYLPASRIQTALVTNGEYLKFITDGGYDDFKYWLGEGWTWVQSGHHSPLYWQFIDNQWMEYTLAGLQPLDVDAPVKHISYYEADAYARWAGKRLLTEFEREIVSDKLPNNQLWEWNASAYLAYPGFKLAEGAIGEYNGKFMVNQMVLRGGTVASPKGHIRSTYRNFWHAHHQFQYTGIRLAE